MFHICCEINLMFSESKHDGQYNSIVSNSEVVNYICGQEDWIDLKIDSSRMHCMSRINSSDGDYLASILSQPFPLQ